MELKPGWLGRQMARVEADVATWPEWMRREMSSANPTDEEREFQRQCVGEDRCDHCGTLKPMAWINDRSIGEKLMEIYPEGRPTLACFKEWVRIKKWNEKLAADKPSPYRVPTLLEESNMVNLFLSGQSVNHIVFLLDYKFRIDEVTAAIRKALVEFKDAATSLGYGKPAFPAEPVDRWHRAGAECNICFDQEGSYACIRAAHKVPICKCPVGCHCGHHS